MDDDMVECPYNKTHRMLRKRLQSHLLKCRLNYPDVELRKCFFNITHLIPEPEFEHHAKNCPDRKLITQYKYDAPQQKEEEIPKHAPIECDENWDDTDVNDYNPRIYLDQANVIKKPDGANRSERKLFIKKERKRLGDSDNSSDEEIKNIMPCFGNIYQKDKCGAEKETFSQCCVSYSQDTFDRNSHKRSTYPSTSTRCKARSRSPINRFKRNDSPIRCQSNNYSTLDHGVFYNKGSANTSSANYSDSSFEIDDTLPPTPPPPIISYSSENSYGSNKSSPSGY